MANAITYNKVPYDQNQNHVFDQMPNIDDLNSGTYERFFHWNQSKSATDTVLAALKTNIANVEATAASKEDLAKLDSKIDRLNQNLFEKPVATKDDLAKVEAKAVSKDALAKVEAKAASKDDLAKLEAKTASKDDLAKIESTRKELKGDIEKVDSKLDQLNQNLFEKPVATQDDLAKAAAKDDLAKVDSKIESTRLELKEDIEKVDSKLYQLNQKLFEKPVATQDDLAKAADKVDSKIESTRLELKEDINKVDSKIDSTRNELKDDIASLSRQMNERFDKMDQRFANFEQMFLELRHDHNSLRDDHLRLFTYGKLTLIGILFLFLCIFSVLFTYHDSFFVDLFNKIFSLF